MSENSPFIWHELVASNQYKSGKDIAGMMNPTPDTPYEKAYWHSYIEVDDVEKCPEQVSILGGRVVVPPHEVPNVGHICIAADPSGAIAHLIQPY